MQTIQAPVTGNEAPNDSRQPFHALAQFYRAFNGCDLALMSANWARSDEIVMDNPFGGIRRGWQEIGAGHERIFTGPARVYVEFYDYSLHEAGEVFYAVGRERGRFTLGDVTIPLAIRTSRIFRRLNGAWRQVHHHGSIDDPALLQRYQAAVLGRAATDQTSSMSR